MKKPILSCSCFREIFRAALSVAIVFITGVAVAEPPPGILDTTHASVKAVMAVQSDITDPLMEASAEILGTAVGADAAGHPVLVVYVDKDTKAAGEIVRAIPPRIRGAAVEVHLTDAFRAYKGPPGGGGGGNGNGKPGGGGGGVSHTAIQTPPIQLGTSGGWRKDLANGYCCGGTLGSLVQLGGEHYILSNYHVFEADIVNGGNGTSATTGDFIIQPGLIDVGCNANNSQNVATLEKWSSLPDDNVDAAIAKVVSGQVRTDGSILEIETLSSQTVAASLRQAVKKSGRTSGLTRSKISGLNATISVAYDNECAGGPAFTKMFKGQIVIANKGSKFLKGGDSGSIMVEDVDSDPRAVGLLFAGSSTSAIANPIDEVLAFFGATMVGN